MIDIPEKVLYEAEVYEIDDGLQVKRGVVKITEDRMIFESRGSLSVVHLDDIKMLKVEKSEKIGYVVSGAIFLLASAVSFVFGILAGIGTFTSALVYLILPIVFTFLSIMLIYWWYMTRSWLLVLTTAFERDLKIRGKSLEDLTKIANAIELVKMGAVRRLQRKDV